MPKSSLVTPFSAVLSSATILSALALAAFALPASAQRAERLAADPNMPVKEGFDTDRAIFWSRSNFVPLRDPVFKTLRAAIRAGEVNEDTPVLVFEVGGETLTLVTRNMSYHHVAQGEMAGEPWMVTF